MKGRYVMRKSPKSVFGMMNYSLSLPDPQADMRFGGIAPAVIEDIPSIKRDLLSSISLVDFSEEETSGGIRLCRTASGKPVGLWSDPNGYRNLMWNTKIKDFTPYTHVEFWMYSENPTGARFSFELRGPWTGEIAVKEPPYFRYEIVLNYKGWKHFEIPLCAIDSAFGARLDHITHVGLHATNWENDIYAVEGSYVYFDTIELTVRKSNYTPCLSEVTPLWLEMFRSRWEEALVGNKEINLNSDLAAKLAQAQGRHGASKWKSMNKANALCLWDEFPNMRDGHHVQMHAEALFYMARAWATPGSDYYRSEPLLNDIHFGLDFLWEHGYGDEFIKLGPTGNWWQWSIGIPLALVKCLLLIRETLSADRMSHLLSAADHMCYYPRMTQANRIWISYVSILSALLQNQVERLAECIRRMQTVFGYVTYGDGFYEDGSFIQHTNSPYIGGYGANYLYQIVDFFFVFRESPLALSKELTDMIFHQFFTAFSPFIYKGVVQKCVCGRGVLSDGLANVQMTSMMKMIPLATEAQKTAVFALVREYCDENKRFSECFSQQIPFVGVPYYEALMQTHPGKVAPFTRVYGGMDRAVSRRDSYCATLSFSSSRICRYESINGQNPSGWYQNEGSLAVVSGDLFAYDGDYYRFSDPHRFPGTTVTDVKRVSECCVFITCGTYAYGGGVDSGVHGFAAAHIGYRAFNFPWLSDFSSDLDLKKAWFFFEDGILCLNAAISCTDDQKVLTILDNRKMSASSDPIFFDGKEEKLTGQDTVYGPVSVVTNPAFGSYAFFSPSTVTARVQGSEHPFFELLVDHGKCPENASLAYFVLPNFDAEQAKTFLENHKIEILANNAEMIAARDVNCAVSAYAFFEAASFDGITTSAPAIVMTKQTIEGMEVSVSDPTHYETELILYFEGNRRLISADEGIVSSFKESKTAVKIPVNGTIGKTHRFAISN